jgi:heme/copper-type cytochrome/quinol oxidase subunit 2
MARGVVEAIEEKPVEGVLMGLTAVSYLFILTALAAGISWVVFVARARNADALPAKASDPAPTEASGLNLVETVEVCFQAVVASILLYFVARHHFSNLHL